MDLPFFGFRLILYVADDVLDDVDAAGHSAEVRSVDAVHVDRLVNGVRQEVGVIDQSQILQQIRGRVQHGDRVGDVAAGDCFACVAGARFEHGVLSIN